MCDGSLIIRLLELELGKIYMRLENMDSNMQAYEIDALRMEVAELRARVDANMPTITEVVADALVQPEEEEQSVVEKKTEELQEKLLDKVEELIEEKLDNNDSDNEEHKEESEESKELENGESIKTSVETEIEPNNDENTEEPDEQITPARSSWFEKKIFG